MIQIKKKLYQKISYPYKNIKNHINNIIKKIQTIKLSNNNLTYSIFNTNQNKNIKFQILNIQKKNITSYQYKQIFLSNYLLFLYLTIITKIFILKNIIYFLIFNIIFHSTFIYFILISISYYN